MNSTGRNLFKRIVSRFLVRRSAKSLLPSINPHVLNISQFSDQNCESVLSSKRTGGSNKSAMFDPLLVRQGYFSECLHVRVYSLATTFKIRCTSITFVNKLEPLVVGCWRRIHADWCGSEQYCVKKCVKKWGEQELDVLILAALCMGIGMNVVVDRDPWILHMIGNSIRY